ncbi:MAG: acyltransferase 3 [Betaproteobacteria bacterium]|nr:acyltransferase 3 [Betaproteobacteria bacterium]
MTFFVISGFLITGILMDQRQRAPEMGWKAHLKKFYIRRAFRIFPLYYLTLLFVVGIGITGAVRTDVVWHILFLNNLSAIFLRDGIGVYGATFPWWSLAVEEQFYLCWAPLALFAPRKWLPWIVASAAIGAFGFRLIGWLCDVSAGFLFIFTLGNLDALAAGCTIALLVRSRFSLAPFVSSVVKGLGVAAAGGGVVLMFWHETLDLTSFRTSFANVVVSDMVWYTLAASIIFFLATGRARVICRILENRVFVFIGKRSYGIYVLHEVVAHILSTRFGSYFEKYAGIKLHLYGPLEAIVYLCITLILATISFRYFEVPLLKMREKKSVWAAI